jgi:hypothetical protein
MALLSRSSPRSPSPPFAHRVHQQHTPRPQSLTPVVRPSSGPWKTLARSARRSPVQLATRRLFNTFSTAHLWGFNPCLVA